MSSKEKIEFHPSANGELLEHLHRGVICFDLCV